MEKTFKNVTLLQLPEIAKSLISVIETPKVVVFYGHMGAGKTTFIRTLCEELAVQDHISSPTFSIVNEYLTKNGAIIYHFDFYRLKSELEAYDLGYEDYLYSGNLCLVEWPEKIANLLPEELVEVHIAGIGNEREIKFTW